MIDVILGNCLVHLLHMGCKLFSLYSKHQEIDVCFSKRVHIGPLEANYLGISVSRRTTVENWRLIISKDHMLLIS